MLGEELNEVTIGPLGIEGDRRRAVVDRKSGVSLSAKRYGVLLTCRARTVEDGVLICFPDGELLPAESGKAEERLSELLQRPVMISTKPAGKAIQHEFPTEIALGEGEPYLHEPGLDAFFDRAPLHPLTTATLAEFHRRRPESTFSPARFRPKLVVETDGIGFLEDDWVGVEMQIGAAIAMVIDRKPRCVMTTWPQGDLAQDPGVLRTVAEANGGNAGVELRVEQTATVRVGDPVRLLDPTVPQATRL